MSTDKYGRHRGDEPVVLDGVTYYPFPDGGEHGGSCHACCARAAAIGSCFHLPSGCVEHNFHWRTDFEAVVHWAARAEKEKS